MFSFSHFSWNTLHSLQSVDNSCCIETLRLLGFHIISFSWCSSCPSASSFSRAPHPFSLSFQSWCSSGFHPLPICPLNLLFLYDFNNSRDFTFQLNVNDSPISVFKLYVSLKFSTQILTGTQTTIHFDIGRYCRLSDAFIRRVSPFTFA